MTYVIGAVCGAVFGCLIGWLKNILIWNRYVKRPAPSENDTSEGYQVLVRSMISYAVSIIVLLIVFLLRNVLPFDWVACLIAAALGVSITNIVVSARRKNVD